MKIAYLILDDITKPTGPGTNELESIIALDKLLKKEKVDITYYIPVVPKNLSLHGETKEIKKPLKKYLILNLFMWQVGYYFFFKNRMFKESKPDLVVIRPDSKGLTFLFIAWLALTSKKFVLRHVQKQYIFQPKSVTAYAKRLLLRIGLYRALAIDTTQEQFEEILKSEFADEKIYLVKNAVNVDVFKLEETKQEKTPSDYASQFMVGYIGGVPKLRGAVMLINTLKALRKKIPHYRVLIVGDSKYKNESHVDDLKKLAKEKGVLDYVTFTGFVPYNEVPSFMQEIDCGVALWPSEDAKRFGNSSQKIYQYIATGSPVIIPNDCHTDLEELEIGYGIDSDDQKAFIRTVESVYNKFLNGDVRAGGVAELANRYSTDQRAQLQYSIWKKAFKKDII